MHMYTFYPLTEQKETKSNFRSSCQEVFYKIGLLENLAKFAENHLCRSLFCNKVAGLLLYLSKILQKTEHSCTTVYTTSNFIA